MPTRRLTDSDLENIRRRVEASSTGEINANTWSSLVQGSGRTYLAGVLGDLEQYFEGNRPEASRNARLLFNNYKYYNEIMLSALEFFSNHLQENRNFFSYDVYIQ